MRIRTLIFLDAPKALFLHLGQFTFFIPPVVSADEIWAIA
jgi:hypothetical protein